MKVRITCDEAYPTYGINEKPVGDPLDLNLVEIPKELFDEWCKALEVWCAMQDKLSDYHKKQEQQFYGSVEIPLEQERANED